ncbi:hypothetical protein BMS3Abin04_03164 [bacterium BMS3Abin04]|nr:hypothetical protein BMS3Abin04_03164 [bacterium BMS3Abin04]
MGIKNKLRKKRFENGEITQDDLARELQVSRQTINAIENGKFNPSIKLALKIAKFFNCRVEDIFQLSEEEN